MASLWFKRHPLTSRPRTGLSKGSGTTSCLSGGRDGTSTCCGPQVPDERERKRPVLYHVTAQRGWLATAHVSTTLTTAQDTLCYQGCKTDHQNETHPQHRSFPLESFGLCLFNTVSGRAVAMHCVSQTDMVSLKCFVMALNNSLLLISSSGKKNDTTSVYTSQQL